MTNRTWRTAEAIAFACMVLVGAFSLVDGLRAGVGSVTERLETGPALYARGGELLESRIDPDSLAAVPQEFDALRIHVGRLEINGIAWDVAVASLQHHRDGVATTRYPLGSSEVSLDVGLVEEIERASGRPVEPTANLLLFGRTLTDVPVVEPVPDRPGFLQDSWAWVRPELLTFLSPGEGRSVQAVITESSLDPSIASSLGLVKLEVVGAVGFFRGSVDQTATALVGLAFVAAVLIGLIVYSAMSLEVHQRAAEIRTLRSLGASPGLVALVYQGQALTLAVLGATLGSAAGILLAHAVVSFAPLVGLPNLVILAPPLGAIAIAVSIAILASAAAAIVPSRRAAVLVRSARRAIPS